MTTTADFQSLSLRIEQAIREHIAASQAAAAEAVKRAFDATATKATTVSARSRVQGTRRARAEVAALAERLYQAVCARPGEGMVTLASDVGATVRELSLPMTHLRRAGRVRSVGERHLMRYFPLVRETSS